MVWDAILLKTSFLACGRSLVWGLACVAHMVLLFIQAMPSVFLLSTVSSEAGPIFLRCGLADCIYLCALCCSGTA